MRLAKPGQSHIGRLRGECRSVAGLHSAACQSGERNAEIARTTAEWPFMKSLYNFYAERSFSYKPLGKNDAVRCGLFFM
jgi:hypothetical protein